MGTRLYIGNLSYGTTEDDLNNHFKQAGTVVKCELVLDKYTSKSRGFAFVEMSTQEEATKAVELFNGKELDGRALVVNEARPREERPRSFRGGDRGGFGGGGGGGFGGDRGGFGGGRGGSGKGSRRGIRNNKRGGDGYW